MTLLSTKQEKHTLTSIETSQQQNINFEKQQLNLNQQDETCKDIDTDARGHELNDQRIMSNEQQQTSIQLVYNSIQKYDGNGDPQQWLKYILEKFDVLQIPSKDRCHFIPYILTGDAFLCYVQHQEHMPTFLTFTKKFLQDYCHQEKKPEILQLNVLSAVPSKQADIVARSDNVMDCLCNQMLITNLQKLPKFSGNSKENVSKWVLEIQQAMNLFKLTDDEKLFYISLCLEGNARDWFYDNLHVCSTWTLYIQNLLTTFESSGKADISFNRLRHYKQNLNQNVRQYYFDIMKLCKEANPLMDDATKLQYLKDGLKASLRFDVLLKNPQTTKEFLEYAQKIEELKSLDDKNDTSTYFNEQLISIPTSMTPTSTNHTPQQVNQSFQSRQSNYKATPIKSNKNTSRPLQYFNTTTSIQGHNNTKIPKPPYQCYNCGGNDHYIRNCPHFQ